MRRVWLAVAGLVLTILVIIGAVVGARSGSGETATTPPSPIGATRTTAQLSTTTEQDEVEIQIAALEHEQPYVREDEPADSTRSL